MNFKRIIFYSIIIIFTNSSLSLANQFPACKDESNKKVIEFEKLDGTIGSSISFLLKNKIKFDLFNPNDLSEQIVPQNYYQDIIKKNTGKWIIIIKSETSMYTWFSTFIEQLHLNFDDSGKISDAKCQIIGSKSF